MTHLLHASPLLPVVAASVLSIVLRWQLRVLLVHRNKSFPFSNKHSVTAIKSLHTGQPSTALYCTALPLPQHKLTSPIMNGDEQSLPHNLIGRVQRQFQLKEAGMRQRQHVIPIVPRGQLERPRPAVFMRQSRSSPRESQELAPILVVEPLQHLPEPLHHRVLLRPVRVNRVQLQVLDVDLHITPFPRFHLGFPADGAFQLVPREQRDGSLRNQHLQAAGDRFRRLFELVQFELQRQFAPFFRGIVRHLDLHVSSRGNAHLRAAGEQLVLVSGEVVDGESESEGVVEAFFGFFFVEVANGLQKRDEVGVHALEVF